MSNSIAVFRVFYKVYSLWVEFSGWFTAVQNLEIMQH